MLKLYYRLPVVLPEDGCELPADEKFKVPNTLTAAFSALGLPPRPPKEPPPNPPLLSLNLKKLNLLNATNK